MFSPCSTFLRSPFFQQLVKLVARIYYCYSFFHDFKIYLILSSLHRRFSDLGKLKMREYHILLAYFVFPAVQCCSPRPVLWNSLLKALKSLIVGVRSVSGYKPACALDQVYLNFTPGS
jgi:hypothetical protein